MPFSKIPSGFKKGTVYFVPDAVKPLHLLGNIYFNEFDIYGMLHILVNISPPFSKYNRRRIGGQIENTHSITNFSELISKVCINYVISVHFRYHFSATKNNLPSFKKSNISFASFDKSKTIFFTFSMHFIFLQVEYPSQMPFCNPPGTPLPGICASHPCQIHQHTSHSYHTARFRWC